MAVQSIVAQLQAQIAAQALVIERQAAALSHSRRIFQRASVAAKIGVWECTLHDQMLQWSDGVYDIFELPRGSTIRRQQILDCYPEASRIELEAVRRQAIDAGSGFTLDTEIRTARGRLRWIRLTATVECEQSRPVRIFGIKQDITEEKLLLDRTRYLAEFDSLTGLANRSQFQARLAAVDASRSVRNPVSALMLVDLDHFKAINDTFGHLLGDHCLIEAAKRLRQVCCAANLVARIGGDEFAVLLGPELDMAAAETIARELVDAFSTPVVASGAGLHLSVSIGIAGFTGQPSSDLFGEADDALYAAKNAGRKTFRSFVREDSHMKCWQL